MVRVGITATRQGLKPPQFRTIGHLLDEWVMSTTPGSKFHHGMCVGGDEQAHHMAHELGYIIVGHPPLDQKLMAKDLEIDELRQPKEYKLRNCDIVDEVDRMIGAPKGFQEEFIGSGTWQAIRYAKKTGRKLWIVWPDGTVGIFNGS